MLGAGLIQSAMREGNEVMLSAYVNAIRKRGVAESTLRKEYEALRTQFPHVPTLDELDAKRAKVAPASENEVTAPSGFDAQSLAEEAKLRLKKHSPKQWSDLRATRGLDAWAQMKASEILNEVHRLQGQGMTPEEALATAFKTLNLD